MFHSGLDSMHVQLNVHGSRLPEFAVRLSRRWQMGCWRGRGVMIKAINQGGISQYLTLM